MFLKPKNLHFKCTVNRKSQFLKRERGKQKCETIEKIHGDSTAGICKENM